MHGWFFNWYDVTFMGSLQIAWCLWSNASLTCCGAHCARIPPLSPSLKPLTCSATPPSPPPPPTIQPLPPHLHPHSVSCAVLQAPMTIITRPTPIAMPPMAHAKPTAPDRPFLFGGATSCKYTSEQPNSPPGWKEHERNSMRMGLGSVHIKACCFELQLICQMQWPQHTVGGWKLEAAGSNFNVCSLRKLATGIPVGGQSIELTSNCNPQNDCSSLKAAAMHPMLY